LYFCCVFFFLVLNKRVLILLNASLRCHGFNIFAVYVAKNSFRFFLVWRLTFHHLYLKNRFGIEGPIYLTPKGDKGGDWVVDEVHQRVTKPGTNVSYAVLQTVMIHMEVVEPQPHRPKLQLTLI
jgi:hypothetical protein